MLGDRTQTKNLPFLTRNSQIMESYTCIVKKSYKSYFCTKYVIGKDAEKTDRKQMMLEVDI